jgi:hypothetical protein
MRSVASHIKEHKYLFSNETYVLNFIPLLKIIELWKKDYQAIQEFMIYGKTLEFDKLFNRLEEFKKCFNERR